MRAALVLPVTVLFFVGCSRRSASDVSSDAPVKEQPMAAEQKPKEATVVDEAVSVGRDARPIVFDADDKAYQAWLVAHPDGWVVNTARNKDPAYMVLHRASCGTITKYTKTARPGGFTERDYIKVCADSVSSLRAWVRANGRPTGKFSTECSLCSP